MVLLCFVFSVRLDAQDAKSLLDRGTAWEYKGDHNKAIADFNAALRLDPNYWQACNTRGNAWASKGEFADYTQAIKLQPKRPCLIAIGAIVCA